MIWQAIVLRGYELLLQTEPKLPLQSTHPNGESLDFPVSLWNFPVLSKSYFQSFVNSKNCEEGRPSWLRQFEGYSHADHIKEHLVKLIDRDQVDLLWIIMYQPNYHPSDLCGTLRVVQITTPHTFYRFEKAFVIGNGEYIWNILHRKDIPKKLIAIVRVAYDRLNIMCGIGLKFQRGCILSLLFFLPDYGGDNWSHLAGYHILPISRTSNSLYIYMVPNLMLHDVWSVLNLASPFIQNLKMKLS